MFMDFLYVIVVTGSCVFTTCGLIYFFDEEYAINLSKRAIWNSMKAYTYCEKMYETNIVPFFKQPDLAIKDRENEYLGYNLEKKECIILFEKPDKECDIIFLIKKDRKKTYYKRLKDDDNEEIKPIDKQFLQMEIEVDEQKIEIQSFLKYFYIEGNVLDSTFFKWYMKHWYSMDIEDNYKLHIIDNSINVFQIDSSHEILFEDNKYVIKDI